LGTGFDNFELIQLQNLAKVASAFTSSVKYDQKTKSNSFLVPMKLICVCLITPNLPMAVAFYERWLSFLNKRFFVEVHVKNRPQLVYQLS